MSLFLSKNPSTEYLKWMQREKVRAIKSNCPKVVQNKEVGGEGLCWVRSAVPKKKKKSQHVKNNEEVTQ